MRFMKVRGLIKRPRRGPVNSPDAPATEDRIEAREIRSYDCWGGLRAAHVRVARGKEYFGALELDSGILRWCCQFYF
jgi:hypothetical protein